MDTNAETWCDRDEHKLFEYFVDFNDWLDGDEAVSVREEYKVDGISVPSKAFYAGDKAAYDQAFSDYRTTRRLEVLNERYLCEQFTDNHWFERNLQHFDQLVDSLEAHDVVPFVGAGMSHDGGFPTWREHLRTQGRTAGITAEHIEDLLSRGEYETVIAEVEASRGRDVFIQELRDVFARTGTVTDATLLITDLFRDTVITTNYDRLIEQAFDTGAENAFQVISGLTALDDPDPDRVSIIKLHGDIRTPGQCILSKNQYNQAYGDGDLDLTLPIPKLLEYYYKNSSLLFLGCSLNNDRTVQVFRAIKHEIQQKYGDIVIPQHFAIEPAPESEQALIDRNAYLLGLGITGIWFEKGQFEYVEAMLRLVRNELRYRGTYPVLAKPAPKRGNSDPNRSRAGLIVRIWNRLFG
jgi:NAD-dependent SIR2 family protein deacetylase